MSRVVGIRNNDIDCRPIHSAEASRRAVLAGRALLPDGRPLPALGRRDHVIVMGAVKPRSTTRILDAQRDGMELCGRRRRRAGA